MSRALIEGASGDLWMPSARDRIKQICMPGHVGLVLLCSQHFLVKAAREQEAGSPDFMRWMEAAYSHLVAMRNLGASPELHACMRQEGWPIQVRKLHHYAEQWLGQEAQGANPIAAYTGGQLDPYRMLFNEKLAITEETRLDFFPNRKHCVPFKDPTCWRRSSHLVVETCDHCCSPFQNNGGRGDPQCFDDVWTYERCCNTDYEGLVCEVKRKGEEGGCVDCKKMVTFQCVTPPEKFLLDSQEKYNTNVETIHRLEGSRQAEKEAVAKGQRALAERDRTYRLRVEESDAASRAWMEAEHNRTRQFSMSRLQHQKDRWNRTKVSHTLALKSFQMAQKEVQNATASLDASVKNESQVSAFVQQALLLRTSAASALETSRAELAVAERAKAVALERYQNSDSLHAASEEASSRDTWGAANRTRDHIFAETDLPLNATLTSLSSAEVAEKFAMEVEVQTVRLVGIATELCETTSAEVMIAFEMSEKANETLKEAQRLRNALVKVKGDVQHLLEETISNLKRVEEVEKYVQDWLLLRIGNYSAVRCLMARTRANARAHVAGRNIECPLDGRGNGSDNDVLDASSAAGSLECALKNDQTLAQHVEELKLVLHGGSDGLDSEFEALVVAATSKAQSTVETTRGHLKRAQEDEKLALATKKIAEKDVREAKKAEEKSLAWKKRASTELNNTIKSHLQITEKVSVWQAFMETNLTSFATARVLAREQHERYRQALQALDKATEAQQSVYASRDWVEENLSGQRADLERLNRRISILSDHISVLNASMSDNLTSVVSAWLRDASVDTDGIGLHFWRFARALLLPLVSFVESLYDHFGNDKQLAEEIVQTVRARDNAETERLGAEQVLQVAEEAEKNEKREFTEEDLALATVRATADEIGVESKRAWAEFYSVEQAMELTSAALANSRKMEQRSNESVVEKTKQLASASDSLRAATDNVQKQQRALDEASRAVEESRSLKARMKDDMASAEKDLQLAQSRTTRDYHALLKKSCQATDQEFDSFMRVSSLASLVRAATAKRRMEAAAADASYNDAVANVTSSDAEVSMATTAVKRAALYLHQKQLADIEARDTLARRNADLRDALSQLTGAREEIQRARLSLANLSQVRTHADAVVSNASTRYFNCARALSKLQDKRDMFWGDVQKAVM